MDPITPMGGSLTGSGSRANPNNPVSAKIEDTVEAAHQTTDKIADKATAQLDRLSKTAHEAVDSSTAAALSAAEWASAIPQQAKQAMAPLTEAAIASIRTRPIASVAGALIFGYLVGRLGRR
jgi:hypothetical protein